MRILLHMAVFSMLLLRVALLTTPVNATLNETLPLHSTDSSNDFLIDDGAVADSWYAESDASDNEDDDDVIVVECVLPAKRCQASTDTKHLIDDEHRRLIAARLDRPPRRT